MRLPIVHSAVPYIFTCLIVSSCLIFFKLGFLSAIPILIATFLSWFFRDPERRPPEGDSLILAPCDGQVLNVSRYGETDFLSGTYKIISIFMSPLDVHVNRSPVSGHIIHVSKRGGSFTPAFRKKAGELNARNVIGIDFNGLSLFVVQVAGFFARRIECHVKIGDLVDRGQRIGMIRFGSRVDLILPEISDIRLLVEKGAKVRGGETIVAKWVH